MTKIRIQKAKCNYEKEPLISSYGFKGSALTCLWQTAVLLETENATGLGLGVQSVLWSDAEAFHALGEEAGNKAMFQLTEFAVKLCEGMELTSPFQLLDAVFPKTFT